MRGERVARARRGLWPVLATGWIAMAAMVLSAPDTRPAQENAQWVPSASRGTEEPGGLQPPGERLDEERVEPPRGIRPPWREPAIPEQRRTHKRRNRAWPA